MQSVAQMLWSFTELPIIPIPSQNICRSALTRGRVTVYIDGFSIDDWSISFPFLSLTLTCIIFFLSSVIISSIIFIIIIITRPQPAFSQPVDDKYFRTIIVEDKYSSICFRTIIVEDKYSSIRDIYSRFLQNIEYSSYVSYYNETSIVVQIQQLQLINLQLQQGNSTICVVIQHYNTTNIATGPLSGAAGAGEKIKKLKHHQCLILLSSYFKVSTYWMEQIPELYLYSPCNVLFVFAK